MEKIYLKVSKRGVPMMTIIHKGHIFNVCYFGNGKFYRFFLNDIPYENRKLIDIELEDGGTFNLEFVLDGLVEKLN